MSIQEAEYSEDAGNDTGVDAVVDITDLFDEYNKISMQERLEVVCTPEEVAKHMQRREELLERDDRNSEKWINDYNQFTFDMLCLEMGEEDAKAFLEEANRRVDEFDEMINELPEDERQQSMAELADKVASTIAEKSPKTVLANDFAMRDKVV